MNMSTIYVSIFEPHISPPLSIDEPAMCLGAAGVVGGAVYLEKACRCGPSCPKSDSATDTL